MSETTRTTANEEVTTAVIEKVRKLLALSKSPNEKEAQAAAEKAQELLAKYNLSMSAVEGSRATETYGTEIGSITRSQPWRRRLYNAVAALYFCKYFFTTRKREAWQRQKGFIRVDEHYFVGERHNTSVAALVAQYLEDTINRLAKDGACTLPGRQGRSAYQTSFRHAASIRVCSRIYQRIREASVGPTKMSSGENLPALANLYQTTNEKLEAFLKKEHINLKLRVSKVTLSSERGAADGAKAGDRISLDTQVNNTNSNTKRIGG